MTDLRYKLRPFREADRNFILASWLKCYARSMRSPEMEAGFYSAHARVIESIIDRDTVTIACWPDAEDDIIGFVAGREAEDGTATIHFVYVKQMYREAGVGRGLIESITDGSTDVLVTHVPPLDARKRWIKAKISVLGWKQSLLAPLYRALAEATNGQQRNDGEARQSQGGLQDAGPKG